MTYYDDRYRYGAPPPPPAYAQQSYADPRAYIPGARQTDLARRRDGSSDSVVEEVQRDFPPGQYDYGYGPRRTTQVTMVREAPRRARSVGGPRGAPRYYYDDGGYDQQRARRPRRRDDRRDRRSRYSSSSASSSRSPSPRRRRRKSLGEQALAAVGLGGVVGAQAAKHRSRSRRRRSYSYSPSPTRDRDRSRRRARSRSQQRIAQAVKAALAAGAVEAIRVRKEPGPWTGDKGKRIVTAAIASAGTDGLIDRNPDKHEKLKIFESTLAGLAANRLVNGARKSQSGSRGRSQSRGRGGGGGSTIKDLAAGGLLAAAGKEIYDHVRSRSRSRSRPRGRSSSRDSDGSESYARGSKKRSKSVSEYLSKGLAAVGLGEAADKVSDRDRRRRRRDGQSSRYSDYSDDEYYDDRDGYGGDYYRAGGARDDYYGGGDGGSRRGRDSRSVGRYRSSSDVQFPPPPPPPPPPPAYSNDSRSAGPRGGSGGKGPRGGGSGGSSSNSDDCDSDLGDSSDEKQRRKKMRRDVMLTTGLATVATIHAAHSVYANMEKRKSRRQQLKEGDMSPEEARKARIKANLGDAASVGLAALGIKGAIGEWKEAKEKIHEHEIFKEECEKKKLIREKRRSKSQGAGGRGSDRSNDHDYYHYQDGNPYGSYYQNRGPMMNAPRISN